MHLAEYALRDFINTERHAHPASVIVLDDMLPRIPVEGARDRRTRAVPRSWAGDVYKVVDALRSLRPDLVCLELDTRPTGTVVVLLPDRSSTALAAAYDDLVEAYVVPDPQEIPDEVLGRQPGAGPRGVPQERRSGTGLRRLRELPRHRGAPAGGPACWPRRGWPRRAEIRAQVMLAVLPNSRATGWSPWRSSARRE